MHTLICSFYLSRCSYIYIYMCVCVCVYIYIYIYIYIYTYVCLFGLRQKSIEEQAQPVSLVQTAGAQSSDPEPFTFQLLITPNPTPESLTALNPKLVDPFFPHPMKGPGRQIPRGLRDRQRQKEEHGRQQQGYKGLAPVSAWRFGVGVRVSRLTILLGSPSLSSNEFDITAGCFCASACRLGVISRGCETFQTLRESPLLALNPVSPKHSPEQHSPKVFEP